MPKRTDIKKILIIGSGPIVIGQACEFDYSGTQACKALREEGYEVVLINSNPATIMTDPETADRTYIEPIDADFVEKVIAKEKPCAVLPTLGGQTALNVALECASRGVFEKYGTKLIGASIEAIMDAEDRDRFKKVVERCGLESAKSKLVKSVPEAMEYIHEIGYPVILRPSRTLGGSGGGIVDNESQLKTKLEWAFECSPVGEVLVEESLLGWKEYEMEVMRDGNDNAVIVCSIENIDPMGVHTGDSITVAPIQTLTDKEYQRMRDASLLLMNEIGVETGGSNVQFAVCPETGRQIIIELNPRVSRSSALASKATGFPIAKLAAKLAVGYSLDELPNDITKLTPACFEPTIDYVVVKIPRFTFEKFSGSDDSLGTQMKSVGEAMAIGGNFLEAFQKASRSLEVGRTGLLGFEDEAKYTDKNKLLQELKLLKADRIYRAARALELGATIDEVEAVTKYDRWFLEELNELVEAEKNRGELDRETLFNLKQLGESDLRLAELYNLTEEQVRNLRKEFGILPRYKSVDTCAAEFKSYTPYLYSTFQETSDEIPQTGKEKIIVLGGGPNRIGQGLEFDYCCVHAAFSLADAGYETIIVNCNPETVSTDYDTSDKLFFEPLTLEDVLGIIDFEKPKGVIVQYGGQTPLKLAEGLFREGVPIIGTSPEAIDLAEDRDRFREVVDKVGILQPKSDISFSVDDTLEKAKDIGFPLMIRPSFVLGGRAMALVSSMQELESYVAESVHVSDKKPLLIDRFLQNAVEVDVDAICDGERVVVCGILEHIERAGIHSGDSSFILPTQTLSSSIKEQIVDATKGLATELKVRGLMNVQFAVCENELYVIEVNPRASRSVPFVSKALGMPWAKIAARVMAGESLAELEKVYPGLLGYEDYLSATADVCYVAVKEAVFPFNKFIGFDARLGPEMRSTGEVMGLGENLGDAALRALLGAGVNLPSDGKVFFSLKESDKALSVSLAERLCALGYEISATNGTAAYLEEHGVKAEIVNKVREGGHHVVEQLNAGEIKLVINTPEGTAPILDSREIRSSATALRVPLFTTIAAAEAAVDALEYMLSHKQISVKAIQDYLG